MKFLKQRARLDWDIIHDLTIEEIVKLRNQLAVIKKMRDYIKQIPVWLEFKEVDYQTVWNNPGLELTLIELLNSMILKKKGVN